MTVRLVFLALLLILISTSYSSENKLDISSYDLKGIELLLKNKDTVGGRDKIKQLQSRLKKDHRQFKKDDDRRLIDVYMSGLDKISRLVKVGKINEATQDCSKLQAKILLEKKNHH